MNKTKGGTMKMKIVGLFVAPFMLTFGMAAQDMVTISKQEKQFLLDYLDISEESLVKELSGLTEQQWSYTPADGGWSIGECMEHIVIAEQGVFKQAKAAMAKEADNSLDTKYQDAWLISKVNDRGRKVNTPLPPVDKIRSKEELVAAFQASRKEVRNFYDDEKKPFRNHFGRSPYGPADVYQLGLVIGGHSMRHYHQIVEVLAEMAPEPSSNR